MSIVSSLFLALSLSADAFAVAVGKGAKERHPRLPEALRTGAIFGAIETLTPILGWGLGTWASAFVAAIDHWLACGILSLLGLKMIVESLREEEEETPCAQASFACLVLAGIGTSLDSMGVGVTLAFVESSIWLTALAIGTATFAMASLGFMIGHIIGRRAGRGAEALGGLILIAIGLKTLQTHLTP